MQTGTGLEVDARQNALHTPAGGGDGAKIVANKPEPGYSGFESDAAFATSSVPAISAGSRTERKLFGLRQTTFVLSVLLAVVVALAVTSAALAGHYAKKSGRSPEPPQSLNTACPAANPADGSSNNSSSSSSSSNSGNSDSNNTTTLKFNPTTNCTALGSQYSASYTKAIFNLHCKTDFVGNDLFGTYAWTFEDCINNCALFNQQYNVHGLGNCTGVSYNNNATAFPPGYKGNCFLKGAAGGGSTSPETSSAVAVTSQ